MLSLERAQQGRRVTWLSLIGLILVPVIVAGGFLAATWKASDRLQNVQAAVVNQDQAVTIDGQTVPLGRQLAAGLIESRGDNFEWLLVDADEAETGVAAGRYAAVVTIPPNFSKAATSFGGKAADAEKATIDVTTSEVLGVADSAIGQQIAAVATGKLNNTLTKSYLDNVYIGFNDLGKEFSNVADGAKDLSDGTDDLVSGIDAADDGAGQLANGLGELSRNGKDLDKGATDLATGAEGLATGLGQLADGTKELPQQSRQLASGTKLLADGIGDYALGAKDYSAAVDGYTDGVVQTVEAITTTSKAVKKLDAKLNPTEPGNDGKPAKPAPGGSPQDLVTGAEGVATGTAGLNQGLKGYRDGLSEIGAAVGSKKTCPYVVGGTVPFTPPAGTKNGEASGTASESANASPSESTITPPPTNGTPDETADPTPITDPEIARQLCVAWAQGAAASANQAQKTLDNPLPGAKVSLLDASAALAKGAGQLEGGVKALVKSLGDLPTQLTELRKGVSTLSTGLSTLATKSSALTTNAPALDKGAKQLSTGATTIATNARTVSTGVGQFAGGLSTLSAGIGASADGADEFSTGLDAYATGVSAYVGGVDQSEVGAKGLSDGLTQLSDGGDKLADGVDQLATGLAEGAEEVPSYGPDERKNLSDVVAAPVQPSEADGDSLISQTPATTLLMVLALWLGALATFIILAAVPSRTFVSSRPSWQLAAFAMAPGAAIAAVQAVTLTVIGQIVLDLSPGKVASLLALLLLAGFAFVGVNHALAAWLGGFGRLISVVMVVITAASSIVSAVPGFFEVLKPFSPLTPALEAARGIVTGGPGVGGGVAVLLVWLIVAIVASVTSVLRSRTVTPKQLQAARG